MNKSRKLLSAIIALMAFVPVFAAGVSYTQYVNPLIGTGGHGHVFLGANVPFGCFQTLGNMTIEYNYPNDDSVTNYKRTLCLNDATHKVSFEKGGQRYEREVFISRNDDVAVIKVKFPEPAVAERSRSIEGPTLKINLSRPEKAEVFTDANKRSSISAPPLISCATIPKRMSMNT